jgi:hypothetical protein
MGHVRTSAIFYRRGIPNGIHVFGAYTLANYNVPQPLALYTNTLRSNYFNSTFHSNFNSKFKSVINYR